MEIIQVSGYVAEEKLGIAEVDGVEGGGEGDGDEVKGGRSDRAECVGACGCVCMHVRVLISLLLSGSLSYILNSVQ